MAICIEGHDLPPLEARPVRFCEADVNGKVVVTCHPCSNLKGGVDETIKKSIA
jgi:hypothetical protein